MILSVIILAVLGGVAYFHYAQGFFSATLSAFCAVVAAAIAVGYHEVMVFGLLGGAAADYAHALSLAAIFAGVYIVLRVLFDKAVPGNLRLPVMIDRVGGGVMGIIAGIFTAGIVALAAQMLPFGPKPGGFARYEVEDRPELSINNKQAGRAMRNVDVNEQLTEDTLNPEKRSKLLIPADDMMLAAVDAMSVGSMAGDQPLSQVHPDYPTELFGQRIGIQVGAKQTAYNQPGKNQQVTIPDPGIFRIDGDLSKSAVDGELGQLHQRPIVYKPAALQLVVKLVFDKDASDRGTNNVRVSCGSIRLVADGTNYWPIGTMENGRLFLNKADDFLIISTDKNQGAVNFFFAVDDPAKVVDGGPKDPQQTIKPGVFIEAKRLARIELGGKVVTPDPTGGGESDVTRKPEVLERAKAGPAPAAAAPAPDANAPPAAANTNEKKPITLQGIKEKADERNEAIKK
jgi:hypothetical protein